MRRRPKPPTAASGVAVPEVLTRCVVEDWVTARELVLGRADDSGCDDLLVTAWRRWNAARRDFLAGRGLTLGEACSLVPFHRPSWEATGA